MNPIWKLLINAIDPAILLDASFTVAETQHVMLGDKNVPREKWIEDKAIDIFRKLKAETQE